MPCGRKSITFATRYSQRLRLRRLQKYPQSMPPARFIGFGKDPARYRPSAEALMRRTIKGYGLYQVNNVVDIVNLVSLETGFSIGGYDLSKINPPVSLSIGTENDRYEGIGRGELNIDGLPVLRDQTGAFGSPTSDSERTSVTSETQHFLMVIFGFGDHSSISAALRFAENLLEEFASTQQINQFILKG